MAARTLMIQGTGSGVGKSVLAAALCRILWKDGLRVAPFKAQNMALNSFVTAEGLEMGRAQAVQAEACGLEPSVKMNPVLLKPSGGTRSQVVLLGRPIGEREAGRAYADRAGLAARIAEAFEELAAAHDVVVIEGAGSPAEINLRGTDLANMAMARIARAPVLIVGDIDRGGVFAWMKGTLDLLDEAERRHVKGFVINKFRGDLSLLRDGVTMFERMAGRPVLGVVPHFRDLHLDEEDAVPLDGPRPAAGAAAVALAVVHLPHLSTFTDFLALAHEPDVGVRYVGRPEHLGCPDLIVLPGSKNTVEDLLAIRREGLERAVLDQVNRGTPLLGICGGFQMMGRTIEDPLGVESREGSVAGMNLLPMQTALAGEKQTVQISRTTEETAFAPQGLEVRGYEIHMGRTAPEAGLPGLLAGCPPDAPSAAVGGRLAGTYVHGLFDANPFRRAFLDRLRARKGLGPAGSSLDFQAFRIRQFDQLEARVREHLDLAAVYRILENGV